MKKNVGSIDKGIRLVLGLAILGAGVAYESFWGLLGLVPLLTAGVSFCPLYAALNLNTLPKKSKA